VFLQYIVVMWQDQDHYFKTKTTFSRPRLLFQDQDHFFKTKTTFSWPRPHF